MQSENLQFFEILNFSTVQLRFIPQRKVLPGNKCRGMQPSLFSILSIMFSLSSMDAEALHSCLSNFPTSQLHELRTTCKQFDITSKLIFKSREYECQASGAHSLRYQPCCKYFSRLTSGDRLRFVRLELYVFSTPASELYLPRISTPLSFQSLSSNPLSLFILTLLSSLHYLI